MRRIGKEIHVYEMFGPRPKLSQYIDTPEKAARLERRMMGEAAAGESAARSPSID